MSNKPLKHSDQEKINDMMKKKNKQIEIINPLPPFIYIFSEGIKTEPYYISGLVNAINSKYSCYTTKNRITVTGTGRNTKSLLAYARKEIEKNFPETEIVWLMYDKDDFPYDDFDNTQYSAEGRQDEREYRVAWSNECIELWFLLHFQEFHSDIGRDAYCKILDGHFKKLGYNKYEKNDPNLYNILKNKTNIALRRAEKQYSEYRGAAPSKCRPATRVYELVKELQKYL